MTGSVIIYHSIIVLLAYPTLRREQSLLNSCFVQLHTKLSNIEVLIARLAPAIDLTIALSYLHEDHSACQRLQPLPYEFHRARPLFRRQLCRDLQLSQMQKSVQELREGSTTPGR
jgi:hypothetical protein